MDVTPPTSNVSTTNQPSVPKQSSNVEKPTSSHGTSVTNHEYWKRLTEWMYSGEIEIVHDLNKLIEEQKEDYPRNREQSHTGED